MLTFFSEIQFLVPWYEATTRASSSVKKTCRRSSTRAEKTLRPGGHPAESAFFGTSQSENMSHYRCDTEARGKRNEENAINGRLSSFAIAGAKGKQAMQDTQRRNSKIAGHFRRSELATLHRASQRDAPTTSGSGQWQGAVGRLPTPIRIARQPLTHDNTADK